MVHAVNNHGQFQVPIAQTLQWLSVQLHTHYVLVEDAHVGNLLGRYGVSLIYGLDKLRCPKNVLQIVRPGQACILFIHVPEFLTAHLLLQEVIDLFLGQGFTILVVWTALLTCLPAYILPKEATVL